MLKNNIETDMNKTLFVTDLDGTLMRDDKTISETSVMILNRLIREGIYITYATARTIRSSSKITERIEFNIPVITRNGTVLANPKTKENIEIAVFTYKEISIIRDCVNRHKIPGFITSYINGKETKSYLKERINKGFEDYLAQHENDKRLMPVLNENELYNGDVCYFTFIAEKEELEPMYDELCQSESWNCIFQKDKYRDEYWLEICPKDASKATAIMKLKERYNCDRVVVFGDSLNDMSMFEITDEAYAVENAMEELKNKATAVIKSNNDDGVAMYLQLKTKSEG